MSHFPLAGGSATFTVRFYAGNSNPANPSDGTLLGSSANGISNTSTALQTVTSNDLGMSYQYWWGTGVGVGAENFAVCEITFYEML